MSDHAKEILRTRIDDLHLSWFLSRLLSWLTSRVSLEDQAADFPESRAKALFRAADAVDLPTLRSFSRLVAEGGGAKNAAARLALYDLLSDSGLADNEAVAALAAESTPPASALPQTFSSWLTLVLAAYSWKNEYPLSQLDPGFPPSEYSPAGQLVKQSASFVRWQANRTATERDRIAKMIAYRPDLAASKTLSLDELKPGSPIAPVPPHFRPPIPVTYPEMARETLTLDGNESAPETAAVRGADVSATAADLRAGEQVQRMPPIRITADQLEQPAPPRARVATPSGVTVPASSFANAVRHRFRRSPEPFTTTKLKVVAQEHQDGPPFHGLQVRVTCQGVRSYVAGTTNREGTFLCELPVRMRSGLTYDVDLTWPRDMGGDIERKSITLNSDRTIFLLPFYRRYQQ